MHVYTHSRCPFHCREKRPGMWPLGKKQSCRKGIADNPNPIVTNRELNGIRQKGTPNNLSFCKSRNVYVCVSDSDEYVT